MPSRRLCAAPTLAITSLAVLVACDSTTGLPAPRTANVVDTVSLFALDGTPLSAPSAYLLEGKKRVRTDQSAVFDFAFNFDSLARAVLLPTGALGLGQASGLQVATVPFDSIKLAPTGGYEFDKPLVVDTGAVVLVRSRPTGCLFGATVSLYGKLRVLAIDTTVRRLDFQILVDENCGYRGLEPGLPKQ